MPWSMKSGTMEVDLIKLISVYQFTKISEYSQGLSAMAIFADYERTDTHGDFRAPHRVVHSVSHTFNGIFSLITL